jgi:hypothetical protein
MNVPNMPTNSGGQMLSNDAGKHFPSSPSSSPFYDTDNLSMNDEHPTTPGHGKSIGGQSKTSRQERMRSYVEHGDKEKSSTEKAQEDYISKQAVERVMEFERKSGRKPKEMPHHNPGYDVESYSDDGQTLLRYIEVKGTGNWGGRGVYLTRTQFHYTQNYSATSDKYWLYVVENANDKEHAIIWRIQDPASKVNEFWFDDGWRQIAEITEGDTHHKKLIEEPTVDRKIRLEDQREGEIISVKGYGKTKQITVRFADGSEVSKMYTPNTMELL